MKKYTVSLMITGMFLFFFNQNIFSQGEELCVDSITTDRPLLKTFRENPAFTDAAIQTWHFPNYSTKQAGFPEINNVILMSRQQPGNEFIDDDRGGVTRANILAGLAYARGIALQGIPAGATMYPELDPIVSLYNLKPGADWDSPWATAGSGHAWNSIKYSYDGYAYEVVYLYHGDYYLWGGAYGDGEIVLVANKAAAICKMELPPPVADPIGGPFDFKLPVTLSNMVPDAEIFYSENGTSYQKYTGTAIPISSTTLLTAYATKTGWKTSDTISEQYVKNNVPSVLNVSKITGEPLGGNSNLNEQDKNFVISLTVAQAGIDTVTILTRSLAGKDSEPIIITNPDLVNNALVFTDTVSFAVASVVTGNNVLESSIYDTVKVSWVNPKNAQDQPSTSFPVKPVPQVAKIYFSDETWTELHASLAGTDTMLYVVVEDAVFNPERIQEYVVRLTNTKGEGNGSPVDNETYSLTEIEPGKYGATIPVIQSPPVTSMNSTFEIRIGDELKAAYTNPENLSEKHDIIGYGIPTQLPGLLSFTNANGTTPPLLMTGAIWDASQGRVYLHYTDDYIPSLMLKKAKVTIQNTDALGRVSTDTEVISLLFSGRENNMGIWIADIALDDSKEPLSADGKLQFYFKGVINVSVSTHLTGTSERLGGDTAKATLVTAKPNLVENIVITDLVTGTPPERKSEKLRICVQDQVFSSVQIDSLLLDEVKCASSGDKLEDVILTQTAVTSTEYCGVIEKQEAWSGVLSDNILHCQDIDNIISVYTDPIYGTSATSQITIMDPVLSKIQFLDLNRNPVTSLAESDGGQVMVQLISKSPDLYQPDTLKIKLKSSSGDILDVLVVETSANSTVFEAVVQLGFSVEPNLRDNVLEGRLDPSSLGNTMSVSASKGTAKAELSFVAAYVPVNRAWIVDGNNDGQADSIYIQFKELVFAPPLSVTSIDWNYEGAQNYTAVYNSLAPSLSDINYVGADMATIAVLLPGVMDA
ncbi:MAG: chitobiase/beta-hexosaminidase C-terminal domain-containing protein, partial [Fibrobacteria bacterium]|nr:chitobiase/beta-hexosaminidase C-terminal domain-containing protein [Fibrobacteria bacterium]